MTKEELISAAKEVHRKAADANDHATSLHALYLIRELLWDQPAPGATPA